MGFFLFCLILAGGRFGVLDFVLFWVCFFIFSEKQLTEFTPNFLYRQHIFRKQIGNSAHVNRTNNWTQRA